jgi:hypothetical protein
LVAGASSPVQRATFGDNGRYRTRQWGAWAGTGGLCLVQGLKADRVAVEVYERDRSAVDRQLGYRLRISRVGRAALRECLPGPLFDKLVGTAARPSQSVTFLDQQFDHILAIELPHVERDDPEAEMPVSRVALRQILAEGLEPVVRFGKRFVRYEHVFDNVITAHFDDGTTALGDVLVGADGANSHVRAQLLPDAKRVETGVVAVAGKLSLDYQTRRGMPPPILRGPTLVLGTRGTFMFSSTVQYDDAAASTFVPELTRSDRSQYVMWGFSARREKFAGTKDLLRMNGSELKDVVLR